MQRIRPMILIGTAIAAALALVVGGAFLVVRQVSANSNKIYVGASVGSDTSCTSPGYTSIQAAVNAAATGTTIVVCAGTYHETVIISKSVNLQGSGNPTIQAPNPFPVPSLASLPPQFTNDSLLLPKTVVFVWGAVHSSITGLTVNGPIAGTAGCGEDEYGILVLDGANVNLSHDAVTHIADANPSLYGCQFGVAINYGAYAWPTTGYASWVTENFVGTGNIDNTVVSGYQKNGITIDGPGSHSTIHYNTVNGSGRDTLFAPIIGQNGIQISDAASSYIAHNTISGNSYTGPAYASSSGILIFGGCQIYPGYGGVVTSTTATDNTLRENDVGIAFVDYNYGCTSYSPTPTNLFITNNTISNTQVTNVGKFTLFAGQDYYGYQAGIEDIGNGDTIDDNTIEGAGYRPETRPGHTFALPIDTLTFPTFNTHVKDNTIYP